MNPSGLIDSLANVRRETIKCAQCGGVSRLANGLCPSCLMKLGLEADDENIGEDLNSVLAKIDIRDSDWRIGPYEILEEVGRGGMGVIYRARQPFSRRIVALKRILNYHAESPATVARFRREAEAVSMLDHPNILPIYEVGESEDGLPFFAMKFAPGGSLREAGPTLAGAPQRIVSLMLRVARAVQSAHAQGLLHRDLKPGNILLDGRGEPLVSDFGLAKWLDCSTDLTQTLTVFGTPGYIAPEQACGPAAHLGPTADVYSLGAILFDLLAGRPPFVGEHALAVIAQANSQRAPALRAVAPSMDRDLETICGRCLERDPSVRYPSAGDLADDLERWLQGKSILARAVSPPVRIWRWARRNPALAASSFVACLAVVSLTWARFSQNHQFRQMRQIDAALQHSVTILPFLDLDTALPDDETASEVASTLRSHLSKIGPCRVVQRESPSLIFAAAPRGDEVAAAARQAATRTALRGTRRLVNGASVYSIHLVDPTQPDATLAKSISADATQKIPTEFLQGFAAELYKFIETPVRETSTAKERNNVALDLMASGRALMDRRTARDYDKAIECFEKAVAADPSSAQACASLASARIGRLFLGGRPELAKLAEAAARKAVELDPQLGQAHRALSSALEQKGDLVGAREEAFRAIELGGIEERSAGVIAMITKILGRPDLALAWCGVMKHLQTRPASNEFAIGDCWADLGDDGRAEEAYRQAAELRPELPEGWIGLCRLRLLNGDFISAVQICSENEKNFSQFSFASEMAAQCYFFARCFEEARPIYKELAEKDANGGGNFYGAVSYQSALGWLELATGNKEGGKSILDLALQRERDHLTAAPNHPEVLYRVAALETSLGLKPAALDHLRAAAAAGWIDFRSLALDPRFDALRSDPAFAQISDSMATKVVSLRRSMPTDSSGTKKGTIK